MTSDTTVVCGVCGDTEGDPRLVSECMSCGQTFHLNPFNNSEHRDCGDALIGPTQGVEFWCETCLNRLNDEMTERPPDPRAMIDDLAVPAEFQRQRPEPGAPPPGPTAPDRAGAPPPRRSRPRPAKRYRRIDD